MCRSFELTDQIKKTANAKQTEQFCTFQPQCLTAPRDESSRGVHKHPQSFSLSAQKDFTARCKITLS
jgi:hypothetical protein